MELGEQTHILAPDGRPALLSTVSIEASSAGLADALSTACVLFDSDTLTGLKRDALLTRIALVDAAGSLDTL